jgi:hypothetical protein
VSYKIRDAKPNLGKDLVKLRLLSGSAWSLDGRVALAVIRLANKPLRVRVVGPAMLWESYSLPKWRLYFMAESVEMDEYNRRGEGSRYPAQPLDRCGEDA